MDRLGLAAGFAAVGIGGLLLLEGLFDGFAPGWLLALGLAAIGAVLIFSGLGSSPRGGRAPLDASSPAWTPPRRPEVGVLGGVLVGFGYRARIDPVILRVGFASLTLITGGLGVLLYGVLWSRVPTREQGWSERSRRLWEGRDRSSVALGVALTVLGVLIAFREIGLWWGDEVAWPLVLAGLGAALLWPRGGASEQIEREPLRWRQSGRSPRTAEDEAPRRLGAPYRGGFGVALVIGAVLLFLAANDTSSPAQEAVVTVIVVVVALSLVLAPFLWRLGRNLANERAERIRSQEKAEVSAHLHDSVLQTLTLLQKRAGEPEQVAAIAATQERELRRWMQGREQEGAADGLGPAIRAAVEAVEDAHRVKIDLVTVGDHHLDPAATALVAALKEAATNAAKHGEGPISVFVEVGEGRIDAFVRDRGAGFEPEAVPGDRRGVRDSVVARMERHGGTAKLTSVPGAGTEVALELPVGAR